MVNWTETQRNAACMLRERFDQLTHQQRADVFNHLFKEERKEKVSLKKLKDAYDRRAEVGAAKGWQLACDTDSPSDEEKMRRETLRQEVDKSIRNAMAALEIDLQAAGEPDQTESPSGQEEDDPEQNEAKQYKETKTPLEDTESLSLSSSSSSEYDQDSEADHAQSENMSNSSRKKLKGLQRGREKTSSFSSSARRPSPRAAIAAHRAQQSAGAGGTIGTSTTTTDVAAHDTQAQPTPVETPPAPAAQSSSTNMPDQGAGTVATATLQDLPPTVLDTSGGDHEHEGNTLEMVHFRDCTWEDGCRSSTNTYIDHDSEVYKLGGKAYRCNSLDGAKEDIMICNRDFCAYCQTGDLTKVYDDLGKGPIPDRAKWLEGKPFVHAKDCDNPDPYMTFQGNNKPYDSLHPLAARMWTPLVHFTDRDGERKMARVVMCQKAYCTDCSGMKKVQRTTDKFGR